METLLDQVQHSLGWGERPFGLVGFRRFQLDAFSMETRRWIDTLANPLALLMPMGSGKQMHKE